MEALSPTSQEANSIPSEGLESIEQSFIGRWNKLVSTTNWQKGEIIQQWRDALIIAGAPSAEYSDEAWSQRVGGVTPQHVGRLRRVFQRFGSSYGKFENLYWSHFQAAVDWDDAEMWLEGAVQSQWSVADMRRTRQETLGLAPSDAESNGTHLQNDEVDEDDGREPDRGSRGSATHVADEGLSLVPEGPDFGEEEPLGEAPDDRLDEPASDDVERDTPVRPFESLAEFPADFADAFESMKLSILRHKNEGWVQVRLNEVVAALDALKELASAPSELQA